MNSKTCVEIKLYYDSFVRFALLHMFNWYFNEVAIGNLF